MERIVARIGQVSAQDLIPFLKALLKAETKIQRTFPLASDPFMIDIDVYIYIATGTWMAKERFIEVLVRNLADGKSDQTYLDTALVPLPPATLSL